jgi:hypothetical protein
VGRAAFPEFPLLGLVVESQSHRVGEGENLAKLPVGDVIEVEQIHFDSFLKILLDEDSLIWICTLDLRDLIFPFLQFNRCAMIPALR